MKKYRDKNFDNRLAEDHYAVMKTRGLPVNTLAEWNQIGETSNQKERLLKKR